MTRGAEQDWQEFLDRHGPAALLFARQITAHRQDAEDAVHDGFLRFWPRRQSADQPVGLFLACVRSAALDLRRSAARRARRHQLADPPRPLFDVSAECERHEEVQRALAELTEPQREIVVLKIWVGLTFAQAAQVLHESANTVASRYRDALARMAASLLPEVKHE